MKRRLTTILCGLLATAGTGARAAPLPTRVLTCGATSISEITSRLQGVSSSGSTVIFANHGTQVSYDVLPAIRTRSRVGDHVFVCLVFVPSHCPRGDHRGSIYTTTNLRTLESWTLPDSEHSCGGA